MLDAILYLEIYLTGMGFIEHFEDGFVDILAVQLKMTIKSVFYLYVNVCNVRSGNAHHL